MVKDNIQMTKVLAIPKSKLIKLLSRYPDIFARMAESSRRNANSLRNIMVKWKIFFINTLIEARIEVNHSAEKWNNTFCGNG